MAYRESFKTFLTELYDIVSDEEVDNSQTVQYKENILGLIDQIYNAVKAIPSTMEGSKPISPNILNHIINTMENATKYFMTISDDLEKSDNHILKEYLAQKLKALSKTAHDSLLYLKYGEHTVDDVNKTMKGVVEAAKKVEDILNDL